MRYLLEVGFGAAPGFGVSHAKHMSVPLLFCTIHVSHSQLPEGFLNICARLGPEDAVEAKAGVLPATLSPSGAFDGPVPLAVS